MDTLFYESFFARDSLLRNDSLLFAPPSPGAEAFDALPVELLPPSLAADDGVNGVLLCCLLLLLVAVLLQQTRLADRLTSFFYPSTGKSSTSGKKELDRSELPILVLAIMSSLLVAVIFFAYACRELPALPLTSIQSIGIYGAVSFLFLVARQRLQALVNAIFFPKEQRQLWCRDYGLIFSLESVLLWPIALLVIYAEIPTETTAYALAIMLLFVKSLALAKDFAYFFRKIYGVLHLFVYFCALEAAPLLILWEVLNRLTNFLLTTL